jgi:iron complex transport system ATP-binding protein
MEPPAIRMEGLDAGYAGREVLHHLGLEIPRGQIVALAGPNGSGKTTLIRTLLGFLAPERGSIALFGRPLEGLSIRERARLTAWVPQAETPRDDVPVEQYVLFGRYAHLRPFENESSTDRALAKAALRELDLADRAQDGILSLSGGERQRAVLARALAQESPLLLLDEPTSQLDIGHQLDVLDRVRALARRRGVTVLAAIHDLNLASRYADRIVVLSHGRVVADGTPETVLSEQLLAEVWGVVAELRRDSRSGTPYLLPHRPVTVQSGSTPIVLRGPVHVVGGGGAAAPLIHDLVDRGFRVTAGALHLLDSDAEACESLNLPVALEAPFAPLGERVRAENRGLMEGARTIVVSAFAVGPSNLANLEDLLPLVGSRPVFLLARGGPEWDFTPDGRAGALWQELGQRGAISVPDRPSLWSHLDDALGPELPAP